MYVRLLFIIDMWICYSFLLFELFWLLWVWYFICYFHLFFEFGIWVRYVTHVDLLLSPPLLFFFILHCQSFFIMSQVFSLPLRLSQSIFSHLFFFRVWCWYFICYFNLLLDFDKVRYICLVFLFGISVSYLLLVFEVAKFLFVIFIWYLNLMSIFFSFSICIFHSALLIFEYLPSVT